MEAMEVDATTTKRGHGSEETSKVVKEVSEEPSKEAVLAWKLLLVGLVVRQPRLSVICRWGAVVIRMIRQMELTTLWR